MDPGAIAEYDAVSEAFRTADVFTADAAELERYARALGLYAYRNVMARDIVQASVLNHLRTRRFMEQLGAGSSTAATATWPAWRSTSNYPSGSGTGRDR